MSEFTAQIHMLDGSTHRAVDRSETLAECVANAKNWIAQFHRQWMVSPYVADGQRDEYRPVCVVIFDGPHVVHLVTNELIASN